MVDTLDTTLSIIDIILCLIDMGLIIYLFFYRVPRERKNKDSSKNFKKFRIRKRK